MDHTREAIAAGADIIVAQGAEAGGHGLTRATLTLVPEVADYLAKAAPATVLVAAGGIADGRGLAAALMLGADGALIGSRFWASSEALVNPAFQKRASAANGDSTIRTTVVDVARKIAWYTSFTARVMKTRFVEDWHGRETELAKPEVVDREMQRYVAAMQSGDPDNTGVWVGEATGLIKEVRPAGELLSSLLVARDGDAAEQHQLSDRDLYHCHPGELRRNGLWADRRLPGGILSCPHPLHLGIGAVSYRQRLGRRASAVRHHGGIRSDRQPLLRAALSDPRTSGVLRP